MHSEDDFFKNLALGETLAVGIALLITEKSAEYSVRRRHCVTEDSCVGGFADLSKLSVGVPRIVASGVAELGVKSEQ